MLYVIKREDVIAVLEGPEDADLDTIEKKWIESKIKAAPTVKAVDPVVGSTAILDPFKQAEVANTWEEFQRWLVWNLPFKVIPFREYATQMRSTQCDVPLT